jgi:hypothetical protein
VFARLANGNAQAVRRIEGQATRLSRTTHSITYDAIHDELILPSPFAQAVLVFRGDASGEVAPIRMIQGPKTLLLSSDTNTIDPVHNEIFVPTEDFDGNPVLHIFDRMANGDVAPIRKLGGAGSGLGGANPSIDTDHDLLITTGGGVRIYNRSDSGAARPLRIITGGPRSGVNPPTVPKWIPGTRNFVAAVRPFGIKTAGDAPGAPNNYQTPEEAQFFVGVWSIDDSGDVAPRYTIAHDILKEFRNFAVNPKNKEIMISDKTANAIYTFSFPEAWETFTPETAPPYVPPAGRGRGTAQ